MQGEFGDCAEPKPPGSKLVERMLWNAWDKVRGMPQDEAKLAFIELADGNW
jgi:acyl-CoA-binding protein